MNYEYCDGITHTIKKGDTLYEISREHKVPLSMLLRANPYVDVFNLQVGDTICVPTKKPLENAFLTPRPSRRNMTGDTDQEAVMQQCNATAMSQQANAAGTTDRNVTAMPRDENESDMPDRNVTAMPRDENESDMPDRNASAMPRNTKVTDTQERAVAFVPQSTSATRQTDTEWKKYVVKPGDTLFDILQGDKDQVLAFVDKNGLANMYMLPGVAYYISDTKNSSGTLDR
ncbi:LysM peptidoglycan-binding domain-containing protein [Jutongia hominis]|jgi:LysM repeat protein|uniref:LysM peptidoglycan-binding domain-containing protein n=1 Tax=Jutongia hominis TaxID=2763664 RepID=A0ABR7MQV8_9FIRM|nr:LysM domain-containing protein [Jutongia hominis]MBC8556184.1 LysM peptidoglycan-binding domain-containing protein [Jutongia hominis]